MSLDVILAFVGVRPGKDDTSEQVVEADVLPRSSYRAARPRRNQQRIRGLPMEAAIVTTIANIYNSSSSTCAHLILVVAHPVREDLVNSRRFLRCRSRACSG